MMRVERKLHFQRDSNGRKRIRDKPAESLVSEPGRIPRVSRLMALAITFEGMLRKGDVIDQSSLARLAHVTQPRMTQIMNLLHLAPEIQEALLFLPRTVKGNDVIHEKLMRPMVAELNWFIQREMWKTIYKNVE